MNNILDIKNGIIIFNNQKLDVVIDMDDIIWFNANNLCIVLGYRDCRSALHQHVDKLDRKYLKNIQYKLKIKKEKNTQPNSIYINESGLYSMLFKSRLPIGKQFKRWVTTEVIPSIRKYGQYIINDKYKKKLRKTNKEIENLKKQYEEIENNIKKNEYPEGGLFYIMKTNKENVFKIGITKNMNKRCKTYNTSIVNNANILYYKKIACPVEIELCVKSLLHKYRYRDKREFYTCDIERIKNALNKCIKVIKECDRDNTCDKKQKIQNGGNHLMQQIYNLLDIKIEYYKKIIK